MQAFGRPLPMRQWQLRTTSTLRNPLHQDRAGPASIQTEVLEGPVLFGLVPADCLFSGRKLDNGYRARLPLSFPGLWGTAGNDVPPSIRGEHSPRLLPVFLPGARVGPVQIGDDVYRHSTSRGHACY